MTRDEWAKAVGEWSRSGLKGTEFAAGMGVKESTLRHWKWKLEHGERPRGARRTEGAFVRIAPVRVPLSAAETESVELVLLNGVRIRLPAQFETATLRRVLDVVEFR